MQPAQNALGGARVIVLHELPADARRGLEIPDAETLEEEPALVLVEMGLEDQNFGQRRSYYCVGHDLRQLR